MTAFLQLPRVAFWMLLAGALASCQPLSLRTDRQAPALSTQPAVLLPTPTGASDATPWNSPGAFDESTPTPALESVEEPAQTPLAPQVPSAHTRYRLWARYDHARFALTVRQEVEFFNASPVELTELVFLVEPNRYPGVFRLEQLAWESGEALESYTLVGNRLTVPLPTPLQPGEALGLQIDYRLQLPPIPEASEEYKPVPFGYTARQVNLVDWYLFLPPYQVGAGWLAHDPWFFGEHQVYEVADFEVEIEITGSAEPLVLAASALPESVAGAVYRYRLSQARSFVISLSPLYQTYTRQVGDTIVLSYGLPYFEEGAQAALDYTAEALALYNELFGVYPRPSLSVVVADFLDGMEYDGLYFLSRGFYNTYDGTPAGYLTSIAVHETAHQWWYGRVGNDQAMEPWLDEALCTYSERLYYERYYPNLVDWWWAYRVAFYNPAGLVGGRIYDYPGFRPYRDAVYLRGAQFLEALRQRVGDERFFAFLRAYADQFAGKQATAEDFFAVLADYAATDASDVRQLFFQP